MTRNLSDYRRFITTLCNLALIAASTSESARAACPTQGGQTVQSCNIGGNYGGGAGPQVPRIGNLPPLAAGANSPMVVDGVASKQTQPVKILSTTNDRQVVKLPTTPMVPGDVPPLSTMADALARR